MLGGMQPGFAPSCRRGRLFMRRSRRASPLWQELDATRTVLMHFGGQLQAVFIYYATGDGNTSDSKSILDFERLKISALKTLILDTRVASNSFREERVDDALRRAQARSP